jgi:hypothetical protein
MQDSTDPLSSLARKLLKLGQSGYSQLVVKGDGDTAARDLLESAQPADLLAEPIRNPDDAAAMMSGLWLYFDWLDQSHHLSQSLENPTGSFWHAIMHRREGDFPNSKYWYARCTTHPTMQTLAANAPRMINEMPADKSLLRVISTGWNPNALVDLIAEMHQKPDDPRRAAAVALQKLEWQLLFEHCTRAAVGR